MTEKQKTCKGFWKKDCLAVENVIDRDYEWYEVKKNKVILLIIFIIIIAIGLRVYYIYNIPILGDEQRIMLATIALNPLDMSLFEANLYNLPHPSGSYIVLSLANYFGYKPNLNNITKEDLPSFNNLGSFSYVFNEVIIHQRLIVMIFGLLSVIILALLIIPDYGLTVASLTSIFLLFNIDFITLNSVLFNESFQIFFVLLSALFFMRYNKTGNELTSFICVISLAIACSMRLTSLFMIPVFIIYFYWTRQNTEISLSSKISHILFSVVTSVGSLFMFWHIHFFIVYLQMKPFYKVDLIKVVFDLFNSFFRSGFISSWICIYSPLHILLMIFGLVGFIKLRIQEWKPIYRLFVIIALVNLAYVLISGANNPYQSRYFIFTIIAIYFFASVYITNKFIKYKKSRYKITSR